MKQVTLLKSELFKTGGAEKYARSLAGALHAKGAQVKVLSSGASEEVPYNVVTYKSRAVTSVGKLWEYVKFTQKELQKAPSDLVFGLDRTPFQTHLRAGSGVHRSYLETRKKEENRLLSLRHKCNPLHLTLLSMEKKAFEHPELQKLYVNSHLVKEEVTRYFETDPSKINVIHNGVEWNALATPFAESLTLPSSSSYHFLFVGNGYERKGLRPLLHALSRLSERDWHLTVIGKDKNLLHFEALAQSLSIGKKVEFLGPKTSILSVLQRADCLVIPSYYDPFANVTVEALAMGLFVISSKTNGGSEVITAETGSIIEDLSDPSAFESALREALMRPKTPSSARLIRNSVKYLDFSLTLSAYVESLLC